MSVHDFPVEKVGQRDVVRCLEDLLRQARTGVLVGVSYVALYQDMSSTWGSSVPTPDEEHTAEVVQLAAGPRDS